MHVHVYVGSEKIAEEVFFHFEDMGLMGCSLCGKKAQCRRLLECNRSSTSFLLLFTDETCGPAYDIRLMGNFLAAHNVAQPLNVLCLSSTEVSMDFL